MSYCRKKQTKTNKSPVAGQKKEYVLLQDNKLSYKEFCVMMNRKRQPSTSVSREVKYLRTNINLHQCHVNECLISNNRRQRQKLFHVNL